MNNAEKLEKVKRQIEEKRVQLERTKKRHKQLRNAGKQQEQDQLGRFMGRLIRQCTEEEFDMLQDLAIKYAHKRDPILDIFDQFSKGRV